MIDSEFQAVGLYEHNAIAYRKVKKAYEEGQDVVGIVHATGTGKSYIALQLAYDNRDKRILYVVPSLGIKEHIESVIANNSNLDMARDFPNLEIVTYSSFVGESREEIKDIDCDLLILDEFHHIGAPVWGARIKTMVETHSDMKVFGMTAYTVRDRGTEYERDMTNPDPDLGKEELFSNKIVSRYDICDAMIDGVLPVPTYIYAYVYLKEIEELEARIEKIKEEEIKKEYKKKLKAAKATIQNAPSLDEILKKVIKPGGKYIYFCPPLSEEGTNAIETIKKEIVELLKKFIPEEDIVVYTTTSAMQEEGKRNRDAFYKNRTLDGKEVAGKLRIMFAINQYNEGVHAPNIDGVIMGRGTGSDIVYFEQLGRALSVRGDTRKMFATLEAYSLEDLKKECNKKGIPIKDDATKEELIERLIAPTVIDLVDNLEFIRTLENRLKNKIKEVQSREKTGIPREIKIRNVSFDIKILNEEIYEVLSELRVRLDNYYWPYMYGLAKEYYENEGNLLVPQDYVTDDGVKLGDWISRQRTVYKGRKLSKDRIDLLKKIEMKWDPFEEEWQRMYEIAEKYFKEKSDLLVRRDYVTEDGVKLGYWICRQRIVYKGRKLSEERTRKLEEIGMIWDPREEEWQRVYEIAKKYYEKNGNLLVPVSYITADGDNLWKWIDTQKTTYKGRKLSEERTRKLEEIGMIWDLREEEWQRMYEIAKKYYEKNGNLLVPRDYVTDDGDNLWRWIGRQKTAYKGRKLSEERTRKLEEIGMKWNVKKDKEDIIAVCDTYNIDKKINESILKRISVRVLKAKIEFLNANNIPLVDSNGMLIDIFSMSSPDMKESYGVTLEEIINIYGKEDKKGRGV